MTINLSHRAQRIIDRHVSQDAERVAQNKLRISQINAARADIAAINRAIVDHGSRPYFQSKNNGVKTATENAHGERPTADEQTKTQWNSLNEDFKRAAIRLRDLESNRPEPILTSARIFAEIERHSTFGIVEVEVPTVPLLDGERSPSDAIPRLRATVADLRARRKMIAKAPLPASAAKKAAREQIKRMAARGMPRVSALFTGGELQLPLLDARAAIGPHLSQAVDSAALAAYLLYDLLIERIDELIDVNASAFPDPLTTAQRIAELAKIDAAIDLAEREEAAAVEISVAEGQRVFHRPDISVLAVLSYSAE